MVLEIIKLLKYYSLFIFFIINVNKSLMCVIYYYFRDKFLLINCINDTTILYIYSIKYNQLLFIIYFTVNNSN